MYILNEAYQNWVWRKEINEMSMRPISRLSDDLPFRIYIKVPDNGQKDHAHIIKKGPLSKGKKGMKGDELGAFVVTPNPPRTIDDLVPYEDGWHNGLSKLTDEQLWLIVKWANSRNRLIPVSNWVALQYECAVNRDKS